MHTDDAIQSDQFHNEPGDVNDQMDDLSRSNGLRGDADPSPLPTLQNNKLEKL